MRANAAPVVTTRSAIAIEDTPLVFTIASLLANASDADDNALSLVFAGATSGARVVIDRAAGTVTYTPKLNATGSDRLLYGVSDGKVTTNGVIDLTISPVNDAPVARTENLVMRPAGPITLSAAALLANDTDVEGSALSIVGVTPVINGTVSFNAATGEILFVRRSSAAPHRSPTRSAMAKSKVSGRSGSLSIVLPISLRPRLTHPAISRWLSCSPMIRRSRRNAERGARRGCRERHTAELDLVNGRVRFIPTSGFTGTASFRYVTSEGGNEATSTVSVLVASVSGPIVVQDNIPP